MGETFSVGDIPSIEGMVSRELLNIWMFLCKVFSLLLEILSIPQERPYVLRGSSQGVVFILGLKSFKCPQQLLEISARDPFSVSPLTL